MEKFENNVGPDTKDVLDRAADLRTDVVRAADKFIDRAVKTDRQHCAEKPVETIVRVAEDLQHGAETTEREIDYTIANTAKYVGHKINNLTVKTEELVNNVEEVLGDTMSGFERGFTSLLRK